MNTFVIFQPGAVFSAHIRARVCLLIRSVKVYWFATDKVDHLQMYAVVMLATTAGDWSERVLESELLTVAVADVEY